MKKRILACAISLSLIAQSALFVSADELIVEDSPAGLEMIDEAVVPADPVVTEEGVVPAADGTVAVPAADEMITAPAADETAAVPAGEAIAAPAADEAIAAPAAGEVIAAPATDETIAAPAADIPADAGDPAEMPAAVSETIPAGDVPELSVEGVEEIALSQDYAEEPLADSADEEEDDEEETEDLSSLPLLSVGVNTISYTANGDNRYRLDVTQRCAYALKLADGSEVVGHIGGDQISGDYYHVLVFDPGTYEVRFSDPSDNPLATSGTTQLTIETRKLISRMDITADAEMLKNLPNDSELLRDAFDITVTYEDGTTEKATLGSDLETGYSIEWFVGTDYDHSIDEVSAYTGPAIIDVWCSGVDIQTFEVNFVDAGIYAGHTHSYTIEVVDKPATCTEDGVRHYKCECGRENTTTEAIPKLGHQCAWTVAQNPTTAAEGLEQFICARCGAVTDSRAIPKLTVFKLNASKITLKTGQSTKKVAAAQLGAGDWIVSWKSSNTKIVKVTKAGKITAQKKAGKATITATTASGQTASVKVTVQAKAVTTNKITGVPKKLKLARGKKSTLKPVLSPITSSEKITYTSSNKKVATVSSSGKITAKKKGTATITVRSGKKKVTCRVTVK